MRVLLERLLDEPGLAYLLAFAQIGAIWLNHHRLFDQVRVVDGRLLVLNLNLLMWITLIPSRSAVRSGTASSRRYDFF
jgi:uncharacterized membrane protein